MAGVDTIRGMAARLIPFCENLAVLVGAGRISLCDRLER
jgi:hypothetical protein